MISPKTARALQRLGRDIRNARLRRNATIADIAVRAGTSPSSVARLENGDRGVAIGTLADILVVLGLVQRLGDLVDVREDDLGLALSEERLPRRGRSLAARPRKKDDGSGFARGPEDIVDLDGVSF